MKIELNLSRFRDIFFQNTDYKTKYSYDALGIIFNWYEENDCDYDFDFGEITGAWSDFGDFSQLENDFYYLVDNDEIYKSFDEDEENEKIDYLIKEIERSEGTVTKYNHGASFVILK